MKQDWTPTPWGYRTQEYDDWGTVRCEGGFICQARNPEVSSDDHGEYRRLKKDPFEANARRIVAAVNATSALSTESLEAGAVGKMAEALLAVIDATRDYLPPDGISKDECIGRILQATDNAELFHIIRELERK
jgi:hypothetical protein